MLKKANISWKENNTPENEDFGDIYFSKENGLNESSYVFIDSNDLASRWRETEVYNIAELGFGTGLNFINTAHHWLNSKNKGILNYYSFEKHPLESSVINKALSMWLELKEIREKLVNNLPDNFPGFHRVNFPEYKVFLNLCYGDANDYLHRLNPNIDTWYLDGFAPSKNPEMWSDNIFKNISEKSNKGASVATFSAARIVKDGLKSAGFEISLKKGFGKKREMIVGKFPGNRTKIKIPEKVAIIGAGLAGSLTALSLSQRGIVCDVFEKNNSIASQSSGAAAGVMMPYLSAEHNQRSEFFLNAHGLVRRILDGKDFFSQHSSSKAGVIRLAIGKTQEKAFSNFKDLNFDESFARALNAEELSKLLGFKVNKNGFHFPNSGWIDPKKYCEFALKKGTLGKTNLILNKKVTSFERSQDSFNLYSKEKELLGSYEKIIIANAFEAKEFYPNLEINVNRGQLAFVKSNPKLSKLKHVFCHQGYIMPEQNGMHLIGASYDHDSLSMEENSEQTKDLIFKLQSNVADLGNLEAVDYRVGIRTTTKDRMPIVSEIESGVFLNVAHGSRGLISSSECAEDLVSRLLSEA